MINERIITCINLFNSCNTVEQFIGNIMDISKRVQGLSNDEKRKFLNIRRTNFFTSEEKESSWYKIYEELLNINGPFTDYIQKMIISLSALHISLYKERIIEKVSNKNLSILVDTASYTEILNHFCIKKDNKYYIDEIEFGSHLECLDFIRNKLLHGDYHIKDDEIYLKKDNKVGRLKFSKLVNFCLMLSNLVKYKDKELEDSIVLCSPYEAESLTSLTTITERMYYVDFNVR